LSNHLPLPLSISFVGLDLFTLSHLLANANFLLLLFAFFPSCFSASIMRNHLSLASRVVDSMYLLSSSDYWVSSHCMKSQIGGGLFLQKHVSKKYKKLTNE
jgi:hypothetical protein